MDREYERPQSSFVARVRAALITLLLIGAMPVANAATFVVTKIADTNDGVCDADCSGRESVIAANALAGADSITLPAGVYTLTLGAAGEDAAASGDLDILESLTINGAGARTTIIDGNANDRIIEFHKNIGSSALSNMTLRNGSAPGRRRR